ncbi:MAG: GNAT family N-acetyltransferase [Fibrobacterales bacterium]
MTLTITPVTYDDLSELNYLQPEGWPNIIPEFERYLSSPFCSPIKVLEKGEITGIGCAISYSGTMWLAHIIVKEAHRKKGIGSKITETLIHHYQESNAHTCLLSASPFGVNMYTRLGFTEVSPYTAFTRSTPLCEKITNPHITSYHKMYLSDIYALDTEISGEGRSRLITQHLVEAQLYVANGNLEGFYIPGLGEGPILAHTQAAGIALLTCKLQNKTATVIPSENTAAKKFLMEQGFEAQPITPIRMEFDGSTDWQPHNIYSRIGGNYG